MITLRLSIVIITTLTLFNKASSQTNHSIKIETGYYLFGHTNLDVNPGPNWKGHYLDNQNGIELSVVNALQFKEKYAVGIGVGYLNFEGINGVSVFSDFEYIIIRSRLSPLINLKIGYSHLWNQYKNGTGTFCGEIGLGLNYKLSEKIDVFLTSGTNTTQHAAFTPIRIGIRL